MESGVGMNTKILDIDENQNKDDTIDKGWQAGWRDLKPSPNAVDFIFKSS